MNPREVRAAPRADLRPSCCVALELVFVDRVRSAVLFSLSLDLLDHIRHGVFQAVLLVPPASSWSWLRHTESSGPLRTRAGPLGALGFNPATQCRVSKDIKELECFAWCAERALHCNSRRIALCLRFPEDFGGPIWSWREYH